MDVVIRIVAGISESGGTDAGLAPPRA